MVEISFRWLIFDSGLVDDDTKIYIEDVFGSYFGCYKWPDAVSSYGLYRLVKFTFYDDGRLLVVIT